MNKKQIERLHRECSKFGVDFPDKFFSREKDILDIIRWSKSKDKPSQDLVAFKLKEVGCFKKPEIGPKLNLSWI